MLLVICEELSEDMWDQLTDLTLDCNEYDGTHYAVPEDADCHFLLFEDGASDLTLWESDTPLMLSPDTLLSAISAYMMGETKDGETVFELAAFTSPAARRRGFFRLLYREVLRAVSFSVVRFAVYENETDKAVLERIGAAYENDELLMKLDIRGTGAVLPGEEADCGAGIPEEASKDQMRILTGEAEDGAEEGSVTSRFGECFFRIYGTKAYVYGILSYDPYLRQGHAEKMLRVLVGFLKRRGVSELSLEVSSDNAPALGLYRKLGFAVLDRLSYYLVIHCNGAV